MKRTRKSSGGTSFHDTVFTATPADLKRILGLPSFESNDGRDKVNMEWCMETENGDVFTVYDWKEYRPISEHELIEWHIGGFNRSVTQTALVEMTAALAKTFK